MKFITNQIKTGKPGCFEDFVEEYKKSQCVKVASDKIDVKKAALEDLPSEVQEKIKGKDNEDKNNKKEELKEKEVKEECEKEEEKEVKEECEKEEEKEVKEECEKESSQKTKFVKWANLDSKSKSFLVKYWKQIFGDDYVNALVADK